MEMDYIPLEERIDADIAADVIDVDIAADVIDAGVLGRSVDLDTNRKHFCQMAMQIILDQVNHLSHRQIGGYHIVMEMPNCHKML